MLVPATLAALPSTRAIPDRDVFYVAFPKSSISLDRDVFYVAHPVRSVQFPLGDPPSLKLRRAKHACLYSFQGKQSESLRAGWVQLRWVNVLPVQEDGEDQQWTLVILFASGCRAVASGALRKNHT